MVPPQTSNMGTSTPAPSGSGGPGIAHYFKAGFGLGLGSMSSVVIFMLVAALLFIPGFIIVTKQHKKSKEDRSTGLLVLGYILMGLGMIIGLGFGSGTFFDQLKSDL